MRHLDLFSGIGGFAIAAERVGWETVAFCEIDKYCQRVLRKHWPDVPIYDDVRELKGEQFGEVDIITGGFPCQDVSVGHTWTEARGLAGARSGLWSECVRLTNEIRPQRVVFENVAALRTRGLTQCLQDLWSIGYDAEWHLIPAASVGACHQRERIWLIANPAGERVEGLWPEGFKVPQSLDESFLSVRDRNGQWKVEPDIRRIDDGIPSRVDRLRATGNAIVPQVAEAIFREIAA